MREWTDEQKQAIGAESGTLLICAAAGSGKTSVLVERIVRKLTRPERPVPPGSLLVVTFTNAAAAEMRSRINRRLHQMMAEQPHNAALRPLLACLDEMNVCTMDSYCMRLVRENFNACGVEPDFGMIEEGEEAALKTQLARKITDELYADETEDFSALTGLFQVGRDDSTLADGILALSDFSMSEDAPAVWLDTVASHFRPGPAADSVWGKILRAHFLEGAGYCVGLSEAALEELAGDETLLEKMGPLFTAENNTLNELFRQLSVGDWDSAGQALEHARSVIAGSRFPTVRGYKDDPLKISVQAKRDEIKGVLGRLCADMPATEAEHAGDVAALAPAAEQLAAAVKRFNAALFEAKKEKNLYGFSDITHLAVSLLYDPAAEDGKTPLARELAAGLSEIMIDEYQDTNRVQDRLFTCLSQNGENMFLVGDVKQSIYRFRLASPEIFTEKLEAYPKYDPAAPAKKSKIVLSKNFRSRRGVTDTVNYFFSALMSKTCGEIEYNEDEALTFGAEYYPGSDTPDTEVCVLDAPESDTASAEGAYIAELIEEKIASGLTLLENGVCRPARYGDFCILLRSVRGTAETYAAALRKKNIPVYYDSREGFFETAEIRIVLSFLRAVDNPLNDLDLLAAMLSPVGLFTPEEAAKLKSDLREREKGKRRSLYMAVLLGAEVGSERCAEFLQLLERFRMYSATASAADVINAFYNETPVLPAVRAMDGGRLREANLWALYETAVKFSSDGEKNLCSFLRYADMLIENGAQMRKGSAGGDKNSVSILTMHASKGLEYPFVIVGGLTKRFNLAERASGLSVSHTLGIGLKRREPEKLKFYDTLSSKAVKLSLRAAALSEELRIYYVAFTRAKEKLFLVTAPANTDKTLDGAQALLFPGEKLPPFYVLSASAPLQWFLPVLLRHPDCGVLRSDRRVCAPASFRIAAKRVAPGPSSECDDASQPSAPDEALVEELRARISRPYEYAPVSGAVSLHTASQLREERFSPQYFGKSMPGFMFAAALTPADVGTATHKFLQYCDFSAEPFDFAAEKARLLSLSRLSAQEAESVSEKAIRAFIGSPLFRRIRRAEAVYKERSFTIAKSVCDFDPSIPLRFADEKTVVIGKIDLVFIEDGEAVIVDYKTDRVGNLAELPARYREQLAVYGEAVEKSLGYKVKEKLLYSLSLCDFTSC